MTAGEARGRVALARRALSRALRALSVPRPDWPSARTWLRLAARRAAALAADCYGERGSAMATDDQRREAAERLRKARWYTIVGKRGDGLTLEWNVALMSELADAVGLKNSAGIEVFNRLADLIDPDTTSYTTKRAADTTKYVCDATATHTDASATCDMSQSCRDAVACDREALLALALDIKRSYVFGSMDADELVVSRGAAYAIARRIYDACLGVPE